MPFVRLDDTWLENPKIAQAGSLAAHLYCAGITYANRHLTDGFIPDGILYRLADWTGVVVNGDPVTNQDLAGRLVDEGLWARVEHGYEIHDYLEFQPSRAEIEKRRADLSKTRAKAGSKGGSKTAAKRQQTRSKPAAKQQPQTQSQTQEKLVVIKDQAVSHARTTTRPATAAAQRAERTRQRLGLVDGSHEEAIV
jgi:hypothetical protein